MDKNKNVLKRVKEEKKRMQKENVKVVILAGGYGTRISEESHLKPKPMIEIGGKPILWHIMKEYSARGFNDFIICAGYKQNVIKEWFADYYLYNSDVTFDFSNGGEMTVHNNIAEPWRVTIVDTGLNTMTGGRIKRIEPFVNNSTFMLTYGDGVSDVDINDLLDFHKKSGKIATLTSVSIGQQFGRLDISSDADIISFREKKNSDGARINGGYMVLEPEVFKYIEGDKTVFVQEPLITLSNEKQLKAYVHNGFWQCMDTLRDKEKLEQMWEQGNAPWKVWE